MLWYLSNEWVLEFVFFFLFVSFFWFRDLMQRLCNSVTCRNCNKSEFMPITLPSCITSTFWKTKKKLLRIDWSSFNFQGSQSESKFIEARRHISSILSSACICLLMFSFLLFFYWMISILYTWFCFLWCFLKCFVYFYWPNVFFITCYKII